MGIFTWIIRASEDEVFTHATSSGRTMKDVMEFARSDDIKTFDSEQLTPSTDAYYDQDEQQQHVDEPNTKKRKTENATNVEEHMRRLDMDKSWVKLHDKICIAHGVDGPAGSRKGGGCSGDAPEYGSHSVSIFMTDTSKKHNKYYMVTYTDSGTCATDYGPMDRLRPTEVSPRSSTPIGGALDECCKTIASKLKKGYKCRAIGVTTIIQGCFRMGKFVPPKGEETNSTASNDASNDDGIRRDNCVPDFVDYFEVKDAGVKNILQLATGEIPKGNAANRVLTLFEIMCEEFCFTPRRKDADHLSSPDPAPFLLEGGEPTCILAYGPGRVLSSRLVQRWNNFLKTVDVEQIARKCGEPGSDDYEYHKVNLMSLRYFVHIAAKRNEALLIYQG